MTGPSLGGAIAVLTLTSLTPAPAGAQGTVAAPPSALAITGDVATPLTLTPAELKSMPRTRVEVERRRPDDCL